MNELYKCLNTLRVHTRLSLALFRQYTLVPLISIVALEASTACLVTVITFLGHVWITNSHACLVAWLVLVVERFELAAAHWKATSVSGVSKISHHEKAMTTHTLVGS